MKKNYLFKYICISFIGVMILYIIPFIIGQAHSFSSTNFNGVDIFIGLFTNKGFMTAFNNTVLFTIIFVPSVVIIGFVLAYLTDYYQLPLYMQISIVFPAIVPAVSIAGFFREISSLLPLNRLGGFISLGSLFLWSSAGYSYVIYLISLKKRDKTIEEAAFLDGAGLFKVIRKITIPLQANISVFVIIVSLYNALRVFKYTYAIFGEFPDHNMFMIQNYLYLNLKKLDLQKLMGAADILLMIIAIFLIGVISYGEYHKKRLESN